MLDKVNDSGERAGQVIENPRFRIRVSQISSILRIEINNNGPEIPAHVKARIFEPFYTTKGKEQGTGLGLSVSYFIITENHKGTMWVESDEDNGTTFFIELPLEEK